MSRAWLPLLLLCTCAAVAQETPDPAQVQARVADPEFGIEVPALALRRTVEMYQWQEVGQGALPEYVADWSEAPIDASGFVLPQGHANPPMPFRSRRFEAGEVRYRGEPVDPAAHAGLEDWQPIAVDAGDLPPNLAASLQLGDGGLTSAADPAAPQVGDVRVRWSSVPLAALPPLVNTGGAWTPASGPARMESIPGLPGEEGTRRAWWLALAGLLALVAGLVWFGRRKARKTRR